MRIYYTYVLWDSCILRKFYINMDSDAFGSYLFYHLWVYICQR